MTKNEMTPKIIYEDEDILVINKPAGLVVNRAETQRDGTIQDFVESYLAIAQSSDRDEGRGDKGDGGDMGQEETEKQDSDFVKRSGVVHRLDKETSGVLVIAKDEEAFINLQRQFKLREVKKEYLALVFGKIDQGGFVVDAPVARNPKNRMKWAVVEGGKAARTRFVVEGYYEKNSHPEFISGSQSSKMLKRVQHDRGGKVFPRLVEEFTLLKVYPETGRTHQIRVHLTAFNHPVVGDVLYAGRKRGRESRKWCPRQFLHASRIGFKRPKGKEWVSFEARLPRDLEGVLRRIKGL